MCSPSFPLKMRNNGRLNTHFGKQTEGEEDGQRRDADGFIQDLSFGHTFLSTSLRQAFWLLHPCSPAQKQPKRAAEREPMTRRVLQRWRDDWMERCETGGREGGKEAGSSEVHFLSLGLF